jgi:hypothetical protein
LALTARRTPPLATRAALYWLEIGIDIMFALDIIVNFRTSFIQDGVMVTDHRRIAKQYMRTWLFVDVISVFPFDLLTGGNGLISNFLKVRLSSSSFFLCRVAFDAPPPPPHVRRDDVTKSDPVC